MDRCYGELKGLQVVRNRFQVSFPVDFLMAIESNQGDELKNQGAEETKEQRVGNSRVEQDMSEACDYAFVVEKRSYRNDLVDDSDTGDSVTISLLFTNGMIVTSQVTGPRFYQEDAVPKGNKRRILRLEGSEVFVMYDEVVFIIMTGEMDEEGNPDGILLSRHQIPSYLTSMERDYPLLIDNDPEVYK